MEDLTSNFVFFKESIDTIYLDFNKAFDSVPQHRLYLFELQAYGIVGNTVNWIKSFLTNRSQGAMVGNQVSEFTYVISGVPQRSVLG